MDARKLPFTLRSRLKRFRHTEVSRRPSELAFREGRGVAEDGFEGLDPAGPSPSPFVSAKSFVGERDRQTDAGFVRNLYFGIQS